MYNFAESNFNVTNATGYWPIRERGEWVIEYERTRIQLIPGRGAPSIRVFIAYEDLNSLFIYIYIYAPRGFLQTYTDGA